MTTAVGSGETHASWPGRSVRILVVSALAALALVLPPWGTQPATAAPSAVRVVLTQSSADGAIGSELTLTATVIWSGGTSPEPPGGWYVEFTGAADEGWSSGPIQTVGSVATYQRTSPVAQTETITARLATPGCDTVTSNTVTHVWWRPEITIEQTDARTVVGGEFSLQATLTHDGNPVAGAELELTVAYRFVTGDFEAIRDTTNGSGVAQFSWRSSEIATELIELRELAPGGAIARTSHNWVAEATDFALQLRVSSERVRTGDSLDAIATLTESGDPVEEASVEFYYPENPEDTRWVPYSTDGEGEATAPYTAGPLGFVHARSGRVGVVTAQFESWTPTITFVSPDSRSANGQPYTPAVIVTDRGRPVEDMYLAFTARGDEFPFAYDTTDAAGVASVPPLTGQDGESLTIDVEETADEAGPPIPAAQILASGSTTHDWVNTPAINVGVTLAPLDDESFESRVGTQVPFAARVTSGGSPLQDWDVAFAIDGDQRGTAATDAIGEAVMSVSRSTESYSQITATVAIDGCSTRGAQVSHYWWESQLDLTPKATTTPARRDGTFTAEAARTVFDDFEADSADGEGVAAAAIPEGMIGLSDQLIRFTMSSRSCDLPVVVREDRTDEDGIASVTLSRDGPTIDAVRAEEVGVFDPAVDTTTHTWGIPVPVPLSVSLAQSSDVSRAGTDVTFTATVHDTDGPNGRARAGVPVTFLGVSPSRTVLTDSQGLARVTIPGTGTVPTTVTASAPFGCGVVLSGPITHHWFVPTLELSPATATSVTGQTATVTARLRNGAAPMASQAIELTIVSSTAGESTKTFTRSTRSDGTADFSWVRTRPGTDNLTAVEVVDVLPQQDSATHIWEAPPVTRPDTPTPITPEPVTPPPVVITEPPVTEESPTDEPTTDEPSDPQTPTSPPSRPPPPAPPSDLPATSTLVDGPEVGRPGADIELSGTGCQAGEHLTVRLGVTELGKNRAAADGTFYLRGVVPDLPLGRYVLHSTCGRTIGDPNVDITSPQVDKARAAIAAVGVTTASTFAFFVLVAKGVISFLPRRPM